MRWALRIVGALCLGAVTSVVVAWGIVVFQPTGKLDTTIKFYSDHAIELWTRPARFGQTYAHTSNGLVYRCGRDRVDLVATLNSPPPWLTAQSETITNLMYEGKAAGVSAWASGAPFRCLRRERWFIRDTCATAFAIQTKEMGSLKVHLPWLPGFMNRSGPTRSFEREFPTAVMPAGFAANTAIYGAGWFLLLFAPGHMRRRRRAKRSRCINCGYECVGLTTCPECGALA